MSVDKDEEIDGTEWKSDAALGGLETMDVEGCNRWWSATDR